MRGLLLLALVLQRPAAPTIVNVHATSPTSENTAVYIAAEYPVLSFSPDAPLPEGELVDARQAPGFSHGQYLVWHLFGNVRVNVTSTAGPNALVSGVFFGPQIPPPARPQEPTGSQRVQFVKADTDTQGAWKGVYGSAGSSLAGAGEQLPPDSALSITGANTYTWEATSSDPRALQNPDTATGRVKAAWYGGLFTLHFSITGAPREVALYFADYDESARQQTIEVYEQPLTASGDPWVLTAWEAETYDGTARVASYTSDQMPSDNDGRGRFPLPASLFPVLDRPYAVDMRYTYATTHNPIEPPEIGHSAWVRAEGTVIRRANGTYDVGPSPLPRRD